MVSNEVTKLGYREIYAYKDEDTEEESEEIINKEETTEEAEETTEEENTTCPFAWSVAQG